MTHAAFVAALRATARAEAVPGISRFVRTEGPRKSAILGVPPGKVFPIAKRFEALPLAHVEKLLDSPYYEVRLGAVSIMDFQARAKSASAAHRKALFDLYMRKHDRIDNWDLVDRAAPHVVGGYLADRPRDPLHALARSKDPMRRRTAIVATYYFIRKGDVDDTFEIGALLARDAHELVQKAVGSWLREAGKKDPKRLAAFLDQHAPTMPRTMLRYAVEKLPAASKAKYLARTGAA